jgi:hypothetical protein
MRSDLTADPASGRTVVSPALSAAIGSRAPSGSGIRPCVTARVLWMPGFGDHAWLGSLGFGAGW